MAETMINRKAYSDNVPACWPGKHIGGTLGAPFAWKRQINAVRRVLPVLALLAGVVQAAAAVSDNHVAGVADTAAVRRVWVWSDAHIGLCSTASGDRDGAAWLQDAVDDIRDCAGPVVCALSLGDIADDSTRAQYEEYANIRRRAGFGPWFEIAGNHDFAGVKAGLWEACVTPQRRFILADGNGVWICFGVEVSGAGGRISEDTLRWLREAIARNQDRNEIVCSHQAVSHTVLGSQKDYRALYCPSATDPAPERPPADADPATPKRETTDAALQRVERIVDELRVDLWLCGHIHSNQRTAESIARRGRTTFINVASITHAYGDHASGSFVLEFRDGARTVDARYRDHGTGKFDEAFSTTVEFPQPWRFSGPPKFEAALPAPAAASADK